MLEIETSEKPKLRLPAAYNADSAETKEGRRKLFEAINASHSKESEAAMDRLHQRFFGLSIRGISRGEI